MRRRLFIIEKSKAKLTEERILQHAQVEFLQKGFTGASTRIIAQQAGMTTGAIYRYFPDKNALFQALVDPVIAGFKERFQATVDHQTQLLNTQQALPEYEVLEQSLSQLIAYIYEHFDAFDLLVNSSAGSSRAEYVDVLIEMDIESTRGYLEHMTRLNLPLPQSLDRHLPLLIKHGYRQVLEIVASRMSQSEAEEYLRLLAPFLHAGWSTLLEGNEHE